MSLLTTAADALVNHHLRIVVAPVDPDPPFPVQAFVEEDDTYRVLSADPVVRPRVGPVGPLLSEATQSDPLAPGSVVVESGEPVRLLAVMHDLNQEPSWREEWISDALKEILREAESQKLEAIALPMLGTVHGSLDPRRFLELLAGALNSVALTRLQRIWLVIRRGTPAEIFAQLAGYDCEVRTD